MVLRAAKSLFVADEADNRNNNINFIRYVAAAMVIYGHMGHLAGIPVPLLFGEEISTIAVKVFFVLSGYLITQSYHRDGNPFRYGIRRVFRIFPGLIFFCLIATFVIGPFLSANGARAYLSDQATFYYFINNCVMRTVYILPGVFTNNIYPDAVNGSLWTLPVEFSMYILLPLVLVVLKKLHAMKPGIACIAIIAIVLQLVHIAFFPHARYVLWGTDIFQGLDLAPYFFAGAFFCFPGIVEKLNLQVALFLAFIAGISSFSAAWGYEIVIFLTLPYITLACSFASPAIFGRVFAVNDYSYGLYLWGFFIQQIVVSVLGADTLSIVPYMLLCLVISTLCAMASWFLVEKPCSALGKRITKWSRARENNKLESTPR